MRETVKHLAVSIVTAALLAGCAAIQAREAEQKESVLSAAGFQMKLADTPERVAHLQQLTPRKIVPHMKDGKLLYVYADPTGCKCVYVGDQAAYQRYQQLAIQQQLAQENMMAAQMNEDAAMNWGLWGPFWW
jgi:hypothetical protein